MENSNTNNKDFPEEIKTENDNINPLLDIIANIQEKLDNSNQNSNNINNNQNAYNNVVPPNFSNQQNRLLYK